MKVSSKLTLGNHDGSDTLLSSPVPGNGKPGVVPVVGGRKVVPVIIGGDSVATVPGIDDTADVVGVRGKSVVPLGRVSSMLGMPRLLPSSACVPVAK